MPYFAIKGHFKRNHVSIPKMIPLTPVFFITKFKITV
jgi:hypothetical protein